MSRYEEDLQTNPFFKALQQDPKYADMYRKAFHFNGVVCVPSGPSLKATKPRFDAHYINAHILIPTLAFHNKSRPSISAVPSAIATAAAPSIATALSPIAPALTLSLRSSTPAMAAATSISESKQPTSPVASPPLPQLMTPPPSSSQLPLVSAVAASLDAGSASFAPTSGAASSAAPAPAPVPAPAPSAPSSAPLTSDHGNETVSTHELMAAQSSNTVFSNLNGALIRIDPKTSSLTLHSTDKGKTSARVVKILFEELHYDDDFQSCRVLCVSAPLWGRLPPEPPGVADGSSSSSANSNTTKGRQRDGTVSGVVDLTQLIAEQPRVERRSLELHKKIIVSALGAKISTKHVFESTALDFFMSEYQREALNLIKKSPKFAAGKIRVACRKAMSDCLAGVKESVLNAWPAHLRPELEVAVHTHILASLHGCVWKAVRKVYAARDDCINVGLEELQKNSLKDLDVSGAIRDMCEADLSGALPLPLPLPTSGTEAVGVVSLATAEPFLPLPFSPEAPAGALALSPPVSSLSPTASALALAGAVGVGSVGVMGSPAAVSGFVSTRSASPSVVSAPARLPSEAMPLDSRGPVGGTAPGLADNESDWRNGVWQPSAAIRELHKLSSFHTPLEKICCVADVVTLLTRAIDYRVKLQRESREQRRRQRKMSLMASAAPLSNEQAVQVAQLLVSTSSPTAETANPSDALPVISHDSESERKSSEDTMALSPSALQPGIRSTDRDDGGTLAGTASPEGKEQPFSLSADDILPLFLYALIKAQPKHVFSNVVYMKCFQPERHLLPASFAQLEFYLATFKAAAKYVETESLRKAALAARGINANSVAALNMLLDAGPSGELDSLQSHLFPSPPPEPSPLSVSNLVHTLSPKTPLTPPAGTPTSGKSLSPSPRPTAASRHPTPLQSPTGPTKGPMLSPSGSNNGPHSKARTSPAPPLSRSMTWHSAAIEAGPALLAAASNKSSPKMTRKLAPIKPKAMLPLKSPPSTPLVPTMIVVPLRASLSATSTPTTPQTAPSRIPQPRANGTISPTLPSDSLMNHPTLPMSTADQPSSNTVNEVSPPVSPTSAKPIAANSRRPHKLSPSAVPWIDPLARPVPANPASLAPVKAVTTAVDNTLEVTNPDLVQMLQNMEKMNKRIEQHNAGLLPPPELVPSSIGPNSTALSFVVDLSDADEQDFLRFDSMGLAETAKLVSNAATVFDDDADFEPADSFKADDDRFNGLRTQTSTPSLSVEPSLRPRAKSADFLAPSRSSLAVPAPVTVVGSHVLSFPPPPSPTTSTSSYLGEDSTRTSRRSSLTSVESDIVVVPASTTMIDKEDGVLVRATPSDRPVNKMNQSQSDRVAVTETDPLGAIKRVK